MANSGKTDSVGFKRSYDHSLIQRSDNFIKPVKKIRSPQGKKYWISGPSHKH